MSFETVELPQKKRGNTEIKARYDAASEYKDKGSGVVLYKTVVCPEKKDRGESAFRSHVKRGRTTLGGLLKMPSINDNGPTFNDFKRIGVEMQCFETTIDGTEYFVWAGKSCK